MNGLVGFRQYRRNNFTRNMIISMIVKKYIGKPYDKDSYNCWHFLKDFYGELEHELFDIHLKSLDKDWAYKGVNYFLDNVAHDWVKIRAPQEYDAVLFKNYKGIAFHAGVMIDEPRFIHCAENVGVIISRIDDNAWHKRIEGFYRLKDRDI